MTSTSGPPDPRDRPGVRANALSAASFVPLSTIDARVSDAVLDVLEDAGVAAYLEPSLGEVGPYRDVRSHGRPTHALYVDGALQDVAAAVLRVELPGLLAEVGPTPTDDDEAFAAIVAGFELGDVAPDAHRPTTSGADPDRRADDADDDVPWTRGPVATGEDDEFVPPPPPPLPRLRGAALWGTVALVSGIALLVLLPLGGVTSRRQTVAGILLTVAGVATLLWQMRDAPPTDSGPDDGAVV